MSYVLGVDSEDPLGIIPLEEKASGTFEYFSADTLEAPLLQRILGLADSDVIRFLSGVSVRGVRIEFERYVLVGPAHDCCLAKVCSVMEADRNIYLWVCDLPDAIEVEPGGALFAMLTPDVLSSTTYRLLDFRECIVTSLWDYPDYVDPTKRRFIVRW